MSILIRAASSSLGTVVPSDALAFFDRHDAAGLNPIIQAPNGRRMSVGELKDRVAEAAAEAGVLRRRRPIHVSEIFAI